MTVQIQNIHNVHRLLKDRQLVCLFARRALLTLAEHSLNPVILIFYLQNCTGLQSVNC